MFKTGTIQDVVVRNLGKFIDERGWLSELFRSDDIAEEFFPAMGYISMTSPGVARGPHEHVEQADCFAFVGPSNFKIYLWDGRRSSTTYHTRNVLYAGEDAPRLLIIPAGIVHAYRNVGESPGMVLNFPNRLYAGKGKKSPVDEIRHEGDPNSPYQLD
ncbi:MAG TPA: dTDP-4-dehydrorhamnose 3,5-epimerase family protein [Bacteroidota bacterium]|nr:dTDP-4-dehydrorhamnose 3,5-epimerase family protein [Bacteroidota bacterium]